MPRKEPIKLNEFLFLVDEEQNVRLMFCDLFVEGTQEAVSCIANDEVNNMHVVNVAAEDGCLKVWVKDYEDDDVPPISMEGYK